MVLATQVMGPGLSAREAEVVRLFASGMKLAAVGRQLGVSTHTAKEYLDRARRKYADVGRPARTRTELYIEAVADGLLPGGGLG
jgi:DNA-binding CsgD family transcriptional regulator